jgi:hypothetical protein
MTDRTTEELASLAVNAGRALQDERRHYEVACQENARLRATIERVRAVLETEHVTGRSALDYRGLILTALMANEPKET